MTVKFEFKLSFFFSEKIFLQIQLKCGHSKKINNNNTLARLH